MTLCMKNPKESTKLAIKTNKKICSNIVRYKINVQNSITFIYICNEQSKNGIKKTILFTTAST